MDSHSHSHSQQQVNNNEQEPNKATNNGGSGTSSSNGNLLCRQSSTRWTPTTDQIRILKDLYYNNGIRSPTAEQIQRISSKLRQYGKIEGKNVFYWFQNHKARERQKKRFTAPPDHLHHQFVGSNNNISTGTLVGCYRANPTNYVPSPAAASVYKFSDFNDSAGAAGVGSSTGLLNAGSNMCNYGYGSAAMEKSFRECSITQQGGGNVNGIIGGSMGQNIPWIGVNDQYNNNNHHYSTYPTYHHDKRSYIINEDQTLDMEYDPEDEEDSTNHAIETLRLFPMHGEEDRTRPHTYDFFSANGGSWYENDAVKHPVYSPRASLELSLNSCFANFNN